MYITNTRPVPKHYIIAVSYTHLDVYKRQEQHNKRSNEFSSDTEEDARKKTTVIYDHVRSSEKSYVEGIRVLEVEEQD